MNYLSFSAVVFLVWFGCFPCLADVVALKNGDRISGAVTDIGKTALTVETAYAGKVEVQLDAVSGLTTEKPRFIRLKDGTVASGVLDYETEQHLSTPEGSVPLDLAAVEHIAATKEELEKAVKRAGKVWSGTLASGVSFRSGTTDTFDSTLDLTVARKKPLHALTLKLNGAYGETEDVLNTQRLYGEAKWQIYPKKKRLYLFWLASGEHDKPRQLQLRTTLGGGLGYDFIKAERRSLSAEFGIDYAREKWRNYGPGEYRLAKAAAWEASLLEIQNLASEIGAGGLSGAALLTAPGVAYRLLVPGPEDKTRDEDRWSARLSSQFAQRLFKNAEIKDSLTVLPSVDDFGEFRLTNSLGFTTPVTDSLDLRLHLQTEYDSDPGARDVDKVENIFTAGLRWGF